MKPQYEPRTLEQGLGYLVEEAGEVLAAAGKTLRWGLNSTNPELKEGEPLYGETNAEWLLRECDDLENAIRLVRTRLIQDFPRDAAVTYFASRQKALTDRIKDLPLPEQFRLVADVVERPDAGPAVVKGMALPLAKYATDKLERFVSGGAVTE